MAPSLGARLVELIDRPWSELTDHEREEFDRWLRTAGAGVNLYTLMRAAKRGNKSSSSTKILAVRGEPEEP